ncbi:MAG: helix-turn-helix transcriptional regulator [Sphingomonadaceae bacterium]|nr:helix-turn-helix transcriptional regulator [Sphingomonadaceae bacterium]
MSPIVDFDSAIADRIRAERSARGWSIAELAGKASVSKAMISRIERGEASPTATLLVKIATAFGLTMASFFSRIEEKQQRLSRLTNQPVWTDPETGYRRRQILAQSGFPLEITEVELPPCQEVALPGSSYTFVRQAIWVTSGTLRLFEGGDWHDLAEGDCFAFGPPSDVIFANGSDQPCRYTVFLGRM